MRFSAPTAARWSRSGCWCCKAGTATSMRSGGKRRSPRRRGFIRNSCNGALDPKSIPPALDQLRQLLVHLLGVLADAFQRSERMDAGCGVDAISYRHAEFTLCDL